MVFEKLSILAHLLPIGKDEGRWTAVVSQFFSLLLSSFILAYSVYVVVRIRSEADWFTKLPGIRLGGVQDTPFRQ